VRDAAPGDPASDIYAMGALLYFAVTGHEPALDPAAVRPPTELRPTCPRVIERMVVRALRPQPESRYFTAAEMLEDLASEAGTYDTTSATLGAAVSWTRTMPIGSGGSAARWATTTSSWICSVPVASGGSTGYAISSSNGWWRSRCCTRG
jgi:hypothetical protein